MRSRSVTLVNGCMSGSFPITAQEEEWEGECEEEDYEDDFEEDYEEANLEQTDILKS